VRRLEFLIPNRPLSLQAADRPNFQAYKRYIRTLAAMAWNRAPVSDGEINVSIVFLCDERAPIDVDNIIKPIQDAMNDVVYTDDVLVTDTDSHRRYLQSSVDLTDCSPALIDLLVSGEEGVYVRVRNAGELARHL
jgi:crossover junction endodeoxyribonuclease RusA